MKKQSEKILDDYLKQVRDSLEYMPKTEVEDRINTIRAHILDALEDQKGEIPEEEIVKKAIKDLGIKIKPKRTVRDVLLDFIGYGIVGLFILFLDWIFFYPYFKFNVIIPYLVIIFPVACALEIWNFVIKPRLPDPRYNLIFAWIFYPIFIIEMIFLKMPDPIPLVTILIYGILMTIMTILSLVIPEEIIEKECPKCGEVLPKKAKFCLMCGEEQE
ncbi:MAG: zinc ribbon domain-containing protein [Promethearchaeota archaeon]